MILKKIRLENFRQFYGAQEIKFADNDKNLTIILGENGSGKTGIFRALIFALFGDTNIDQDTKNSDLHFINFLALSENGGRPTGGFVEITFVHNNQEYRLKRKFKGVENSNGIMDEINGVELYIKSKIGDYNPTPIIDKFEIENIIDNIIDKDTKNFFFFDGERVESLSKTNQEVRNEVKKVLVQLLKIDQIEKAINIIKNAHNNESKKITKISKNTDIQSKQREIDDIKLNIEETKTIINELNQELNEIRKTIDSYNVELEKNKDISVFIEKKREIKSSASYINQNINKSKEFITDYLIDNAASILLSDSFMETREYLNVATSELSNVIDYNALTRSLDDGYCLLCNTDLTKNKDAHDYVEYLKNTYKNIDLSTFINVIQNTIIQQEQTKNSNINKIEKEIQDFIDSKSQINVEQIKIDNIDKKIKEKSINESELKKIQVCLDKYKKDEIDIKVSIKKLEDDINNYNNAKINKEEEFNNLISKERDLKIDLETIEYLKNLQSKFTNLYNEYSDNMRDKLSNEMTLIFKKLIAKKDRELINMIYINDKYEIVIRDYSDVDITDDISQGQREIVSLAFITALSEIAAKDSGNSAFPLFMDTPLGRISGENRENLLRNLPSLTSQLILLLTDTEYTIDEERVVKDTQFLGEYYELEQIRKYNTQIVYHDIKNTISKRGY